MNTKREYEETRHDDSTIGGIICPNCGQKKTHCICYRFMPHVNENVERFRKEEEERNRQRNKYANP